MKRRYFLSSWVLLSLAVFFAGQASAQYQYASATFSNDLYIRQIDFQSQFYGYNSAVNRPTTDGLPAYNYSTHIMYDRSLSTYRLYSGGRWREGSSVDGDHVLQHRSASGAGGTWSMPHPSRPEYYNGQDYNSDPGKWYSNQSLEPEVFRVNNTYYMYTQVMIEPGQPIDLPGQTAVTPADRIQLFTSPDGDNWIRKTDRGVVTNINDPTRTMLHHQEFVYVPWDPNGKPYYLYVAADFNGVPQGHYLIRSSSPDTYDWQQKVGTWLPELGNQIGYALQAPGGPLFTRITFVNDATGRAVPSLVFSRNGVNWSFADPPSLLLAGSTDNNNNKNSYFLGLSTIDGTGELEYLGNNTYRAIYGATTSNSPSAPEIWNSEIGVGELIFTIVPEPSSLLLLLSGAGMALLIAWRYHGKRSKVAHFRASR